MRLVHFVAVSLAIAPAVALSEELAAETQAVAARSTRHELLLTPASLLMTGGTDLTGAVSGGLSYGFKLSDSFALQARFAHRLTSWATGFYDDAINMPMRGEPFFESTLPRWTATVGTEFQPTLISFEFWGIQSQGQLLLSGGLGASEAQWVVLHGRTPGDWSWFDTGVRPALHVGGGVALRIGPHVAVRFEVTNVSMSNAVSSVNGCSANELRDLDTSARGGVPPAVSNSCRADSFTTQAELSDAMQILLWNSEGIRHDLSLALGVSALF